MNRKKENRIQHRQHLAVPDGRSVRATGDRQPLPHARSGHSVGQPPRRLHGAVVHGARLSDRTLAQDDRSTLTLANPKFVYYLSAEYLPGKQLEQNLLYTDTTELARESLAKYDLRAGSTISTWMLNRGWATVVWAAWQPAFSIPWPLSTSRPSATGFVTSSASFARRSRMAGRSRNRTAGCCTATPGNFRRRTTWCRSASGGTRRRTWPRTAALRTRWVPASRSVGRTVHDTRARATRPRPSTSCDSGGHGPREEFDFQLFDVGGLHAGGRREGAVRDDQQSAVSQRCESQRPATASQAAVLLRRLLAARHHSAASN